MSKNTTFQLEAAGATIIDDDMILALTEGLPESYPTFIVTLDSIPADDLTLDIVITCLLNEEMLLSNWDPHLIQDQSPTLTPTILWDPQPIPETSNCISIFIILF